MTAGAPHMCPNQQPILKKQDNISAGRDANKRGWAAHGAAYLARIARRFVSEKKYRIWRPKF